MHDPWTWMKEGALPEGMGGTRRRGQGEKDWDNYNSIIDKIYFKKQTLYIDSFLGILSQIQFLIPIIAFFPAFRNDIYFIYVFNQRYLSKL